MAVAVDVGRVWKRIVGRRLTGFGQAQQFSELAACFLRIFAQSVALTDRQQHGAIGQKGHTTSEVTAAALGWADLEYNGDISQGASVQNSPRYGRSITVF